VDRHGSAWRPTVSPSNSPQSPLSYFLAQKCLFAGDAPTENSADNAK
jgi:hypothetical protein